MAAWETTRVRKYLEWAKYTGYVTLDIPMPMERLADHRLKIRGQTMVSPQNQHLDVFGVFNSPSAYKQDQNIPK